MLHPISYESAWLALYALKTPSMVVASSALLEISAALKVSTAMAKVYPKDYQKRLRPLRTAFEDMRFPKKDGDARQASIIISQLINRHLCPLDDVWLDEEAMNFADDFTLHIAVQGLKMSMEDFGDCWNTHLLRFFLYSILLIQYKQIAYQFFNISLFH